MSIVELLNEFKLWFGATERPVAALEPAEQTSRKQPGGTLCYVVEDEKGIRQFISMVLKPMGIQVEEFASAQALMEGLDRGHPQLIFLDISLEHSDAVEVLHGLAKVGYSGAVNLMSGRHGSLLESVRKIGERHSLLMLPALLKPFDVATIRAIARDTFSAVLKPKRPRVTVTIDDALKQGWMEVWYQPKIDLRRKKLVGCEALARIKHPEYGILLPGSFLPGADIESLSRLTEHVLLTVLRDAASFGTTGIAVRPAVNIPVDVLMRLPVASLVRENRPTGDAWKGLVVEVTEEQIVRDIARAGELATQLKIYDILLSIDDFGAGFSSLARLKQFPFAELKVDTSFVQGCAGNPQNAALCKAVINLAHSFDAVAVAEGIEKPEDLRALHQMGCDLGQGYLLAPPMPVEGFLQVLLRRKPTAESAAQSSIEAA
jgi:EAL domain-containing protein (putative c-di-GMP-specific phosphodiesterase class I)